MMKILMLDSPSLLFAAFSELFRGLFSALSGEELGSVALEVAPNRFDRGMCELGSVVLPREYGVAVAETCSLAFDFA
jgi:hypothetical protein